MDSLDLIVTQEVPSTSEIVPSTSEIVQKKGIFGPFSTSLSPQDPLSKEKRMQIDEIILNKARILSEEDLEDFLDSLPEELSCQAGKIETYLRYRDIIPYSDLDNFQAMALFSTIEPLCEPSFKRRMYKFFDPEVETFSAARIINSIAKLVTNHPIHTMVGFSLMNYVVSKIEDEEPTELSSINVSSNSEEVCANSLSKEHSPIVTSPLDTNAQNLENAPVTIHHETN